VGDAYRLIIAVFILHVLTFVVVITCSTIAFVFWVKRVDALLRSTLFLTAYRRAGSMGARKCNLPIVICRLWLIVWHISPETPFLELKFAKYDSPILTIAFELVDHDLLLSVD
jgi:hypothetical protein